MTIIFGIDPGSRNTGYGIISYQHNTPTCIDYGTIKTNHSIIHERLGIIYHELTTLLEQHCPTEVAIESIFFHKNAQSALKLGQARGAALAAVACYHHPLHEYAPREIKQAIVGRGAASKEQVQYMIKLLLKLPSTPQADAADALAIALCHCHHLQLARTLKSSHITAGDGA